MPWLPSSLERISNRYLPSHRRRLVLIGVASGVVTLLAERVPALLGKGTATNTAATNMAATAPTTGTSMAAGAGMAGTGTGGNGAATGAGTAGTTGGGAAASTGPMVMATASPTPATGNGGGTGTTGNATVLATVAQIPVGSAVIFTAHKVVVTRPATNTLNAFSAVCTHIGCLLNRVDGQRILCPCHRGVFSLDGTVFSGPPPTSLAPAPNVRLQGTNIVIS